MDTDFLNGLIRELENDPPPPRWVVCHHSMESHLESMYDAPDSRCIPFFGVKVWVSARFSPEQFYICNEDEMDALMKDDPEWQAYKEQTKD